MPRVRDLWHDRDRRKTARHPDRGGNPAAKRWLAVWAGPSGREQTKAFAKQSDAEAFAAIKERAQVRAELQLAHDNTGIDPTGYYVYLLWERPEDPAPLYVGSSGNILGRLGSHLGLTAKSSRVGWVSLIRCTSERAMLRRETALIHKYRPEWNKYIPPLKAS